MLGSASRWTPGAPATGLDVCWYPRLADLPHLFARPDCGAGDEFLVITPDRAIQPCSFHHARISFETFDDLRRIYGDLRERRPRAAIEGCTRAQFGAAAPDLRPPPEPAREELGVARPRGEQQRDWTIVGASTIPTRSASPTARALARLRRTSPPDVEANGYNGSIPTPPLRAVGARHGFDWPDDGGLWWEEDGFGAPVLTAGAVVTRWSSITPTHGLARSRVRTLCAQRRARVRILALPTPDRAGHRVGAQRRRGDARRGVPVAARAGHTRTC
jgi:hypothetical protein